MANNDNIVVIREWYSVEKGLYVRDWTEEEYKKLSSDEHILEECDDGNLIECYCKETRTMKVSLQNMNTGTMAYYAGKPIEHIPAWTHETARLYISTADRTYAYNTNYWI